MSTELVEKIDAFIEACSGPGITLYEGHPAVLLTKAKDELTALTAKLERESGDLRYAKQALDRETARALKFGKRITALTAKVALLTEALEWYGERARRARRALSEPDKEGT